MIRQGLAEIMQEEVAVGPDDLAGELGQIVHGPGLVPRHVAAGAAHVAKQLLAAEHLAVLPALAHRHREQPAVQFDAIEQRVGDLGIAATERLETFGLGRGAVLAGEEAARHPDVPHEGPGGLLAHARLLGLPAEAAGHRLTGGHVAYLVEPARDAVPVRVIGIGEAPRGGLGGWPRAGRGR